MGKEEEHNGASVVHSCSTPIQEWTWVDRVDYTLCTLIQEWTWVYRVDYTHYTPYKNGQSAVQWSHSV